MFTCQENKKQHYYIPFTVVLQVDLKVKVDLKNPFAL